MEELPALASTSWGSGLCYHSLPVVLAAMGLLLNIVDLEEVVDGVGEVAVGCSVQLLLHPEVSIQAYLQQTAAG